MPYVEALLTSDVEEAWQEAVPERAHLVPQTFVDLQWFGIEPDVLLLADGELRPAPLVVRRPVIVHVGISDRGECRRVKIIPLFPVTQVHSVSLGQFNSQATPVLENPLLMYCVM